MKFISIARLLLSLLPVLIEAIKAAEEAIPGEGKGEAKLALIRTILELAYTSTNDVADKFDDVANKFDDVWPMIQKTIGSIVATFNKLGVFKK